MTNSEQAFLSPIYMAVIDTLFDLIDDKLVDRDGLVDSLIILGFDSQEILYRLHPILAIQKVCKGFGDLKLNETSVNALPDS